MKYLIFFLVFLFGCEFHIDARKLPPIPTNNSDGGTDLPDGFTQCDIDLIKYADEASFWPPLTETTNKVV